MSYPQQHYKKESGNYLIELKLHEVRQIFNTLDPSPFHDKDLDEDAVAYILACAEDISLAEPLELRIYLPEAQLQLSEAAEIPHAIHHYFHYRADVAIHQLRRILRDGRIALLIGLLFLFTCIGVRILLQHLGNNAWYMQILEEGFMICGWVAMWRPVQTFLYDWWPLRRQLKLYRKLVGMAVNLRNH